MKMKMALMVLTTLAASFVMAADTTYSFTYQAALRDEHGLVISNGTAVARNQTVTLRLWDAATGGNLLWGRTYNVYTDETGLFNLEVSDLAGSPASDAPSGATLESVFAKNKAGDVHIGLFVSGSSGEIVPRQRLFAVPFAAVANDVRQISGDITVGGNITMKNGAKSGVVISADGISQGSGSSTFQDITANGTLKASGTITGGNGLVINGGEVKLSAPVAVNADLKIAEGKKLTVGDSEVVPVPVGGIIMWTKATPPDATTWGNSVHWAICNGKNGTPDLRGRFVVGVNNDVTGRNGRLTEYDLAAAAGEEKHQLKIEEMPAHSHNVEFYRWHDIKADADRDRQMDKLGNGGGSSYSTGSAGGNESHENRPPYYALYYIMRVK